MEWSNLVTARAARATALGVVAVALAAAAAGCHDSAAGGRPMDAGMEVKPDLSEKLPPPDANCPADAAGGNGICPVNFCGQPKSVAALGANESAELGADVICTPGFVCVPDVPTPKGDALNLRCVPPLAGAVAEGMACTKGAGNMRCKNDGLCIESPDFPGMPFCSALCRADGDCAKGSFCLEYQYPPPANPPQTLPNGSYVKLGFCTPKAMIKAPPCTHESECPNQGCVAYGDRTRLLTCQTKGTKSMGDVCNAGGDCRSGQCFDREFQLPGIGKRTFCSGHCTKSSECGADQRCTRIVVNNNGTPTDPFDDVVSGYCQSLFAPVEKTGCHQDADCAALGGTTCEKKYGLCYTPGVATGAACTAAANCELDAECLDVDDGFPGGYCQTFGCAAGATMGVDACPGADSVCSQRATDDPLGACYEGCKQASDCSRSAESYICKAPSGSAAGAPASICLWDKGV